MTSETRRIQINVSGTVQGVGFRPFVYQLASSESVAGWVINTAQGARIECEADPAALERFIERLRRELPPHAKIDSLTTRDAAPCGATGFVIRHSDGAGEKRAWILPDLATCPDCLRELFDPADRRHRYPFINCTHCGPRYSIIRDLPYDRANTSMSGFIMCEACQAEYDNPADRRFHAQPNACPVCGPRLELVNSSGVSLETGDAALAAAVRHVKEGAIVALKGLGGFHLIVDAENENAVARLRSRKRREEKPLAVMAPSPEWIENACRVNELEQATLASPAAPIVLLRKKDAGAIAPSVAPGNPSMGVMLPYTPLHQLLLRDLGRPVVATSGNLSDEPICIDNREALERLGGIADVFLMHNRPVVRYIDDSVLRIFAGEARMLRRARGFAPLPLPLAGAEECGFAAGAHLKNTVAVNRGGDAFVSQHLGDLETGAARDAFNEAAQGLTRMYELAPAAAACDLHPDYASTHYAAGLGLPLTRVQHHYAHAAACMAEHRLEGPVLAISWDGTGYGPDNSVWGGEFLLCDEIGFQRVAHLRPFMLLSGEKAIKEPRRSALGVLYELLGNQAFARIDLKPVASFSEGERNVLRQMAETKLNSPITTSAGRLFDAVAALAGLRQQVNFEGQAAMELEWAVGDAPSKDGFQFEIVAGAPCRWLHPDGSVIESRPETSPSYIIDWGPGIHALLDAVQQGVPLAEIASRFHTMCIDAALAVVERISPPRVVITGGCFQNVILTEGILARLGECGVPAYAHRALPPNDGAISFGQLAILHQGRMAHVPRRSRKDSTHHSG